MKFGFNCLYSFHKRPHSGPSGRFYVNLGNLTRRPTNWAGYR